MNEHFMALITHRLVLIRIDVTGAFLTSGALATVGALSFGILQFKRGNLAKSQLAMRMRVVAQGGTIVALVLGVLFSSAGTSNKKPQT